MDQKRAWQKAVGKKRYLRILAAILSFCVQIGRASCRERV